MIEINTNQVGELIQNAATVHAQISPYLPALAVAAGWAGREVANFNRWVRNVAEYVVAHGGIGWLIWKLLWNPPTAAPQNEEHKIS